MTRSARWLFVAALLPIAACSSNTPAPVASAPPAPPPLAQQDQMFINTAAASDAAEIQTSQLALQKARGPRVKQFAQQMIDAHTQTTQQLMQIAQTKGVTPDAALNTNQQAALTKLTADRPAMFDRDYLRFQVANHDDAATAFQNEMSQGQDAELKQFAQQTLPIIQQHLEAARRLAGIRAPMHRAAMHHAAMHHGAAAQDAAPAAAPAAK